MASPKHEYPPPLQDRVLIPNEAADLLDMTVDELLDKAERGAVPGVCIGGHWRFTRCRIQSLVA